MYKTDRKKLFVLCLAIAFVAVGGFGFAVIASPFGYDVTEAIHYRNLEVQHSSIATFVVAILVGVVVANALIPTIANQTAQLETNTDLETEEQDLVGIWDLVIIVGVMLMIIKMAL